jgi:hypothetical protein
LWWWGEVFIIPLGVDASIGLAFMVGDFSEGRQKRHSGRRCGRRLMVIVFSFCVDVRVLYGVQVGSFSVAV